MPPRNPARDQKGTTPTRGLPGEGDSPSYLPVLAQRANRVRGAGLAAAGIVIGVITLIFAIAYWAFIATHMGGGHSGGGGGGGGYGY